MSEYVVYHNPGRMGYSARDVDVLSIVTNKSATGAKGARVWLITGEGKSPKQYYLRGVFTVESVSKSTHPEFKIQVAGSAGKLFDPMVRIDTQPWFNQFRSSQGNFGLGFQPINDPVVVRGLRGVANF
jgi:hypothetical protein